MSNNTIPSYIFRSPTSLERNFHLHMTGSGYINGQLVTFPVSGIFPSGEGLFYDQQQNHFKVFHAYGYSWTQQNGSGTLTNDIPTPEFDRIVGISGLLPHASGDVLSNYVHNAPYPLGGTGEMDKLPYDFSFNTNDFLVRNSG